MGLKPLKYNISKQIIEYNWNKKKNIQRRRFKLRRCQQNNTKQKTPVIQQQKKDEEVIIDDPDEKKKVERKRMGKPMNIRKNKRTKISETRLPFTVDTGIHELEKQIVSKTSNNLVKDGEDSINVSLANIALEDGLKVLLYQEGVYYPGIVSPVAPPDIYGVRIVKRRGNKPVILAREQLISQAVLDKKPASVSDLELGSHVCAVWSTKFSCLYPGTVVMVTNNNLVTVMFDDGDCRDCHISDIRFLPDENFSHGLSGARQGLVTGISTAHQGRIGEQSSRNKIPKLRVPCLSQTIVMRTLCAVFTRLVISCHWQRSGSSRKTMRTCQSSIIWQGCISLSRGISYSIMGYLNKYHVTRKK